MLGEGTYSMDVVWFLFNVVVTVIENVLLCYFIQKHFPSKLSSKAYNITLNIVAVILVAGIYTVFVFYPPSWTIDLGTSLLYWLLYVIMFRKGLWYKKTYWTVLLIGVTSISAVAVGVWVMLITSASQNVVVAGQGIPRFVLIAGATILRFVLYKYFSHFYISSLKLQKGIYIALITLIVLCLVIDNTFMEIGLVMGEEIYLMLFLALSSLSLLAILMIAFYLYYRISKQAELILEAQGELHHRAMMEQHNKELIKISENMRDWRHNINNHFHTILGMALEENYVRIEKYIARLGQQIKNDIDGACHTGQHALDAIVTVKCAIAKSDGIVVNLHISSIKHLPICDVEITNLMGNLFDNAIESCRRTDTKKRSIDLFIGMMESMISIRMTNGTDGKDRVESGKFLSIKADDRLHGLGLASIDRIVSNAGGQIRRSHKDMVFTTELMLPPAESF